MSFEPKIIAYLCTWCSYTGADTAGIARLESPADLKAIRVPCSGRVSPELIMRTFNQGADGVLVLGCHIGECHYDSGNHRTAKRLPVLQALLSFAGLEPDRLRLDWVSASEGERFSRITSEFVQTIRNLGPARWRNPVPPAAPPVIPGILSGSQIAAQVPSRAYDQQITSELRQHARQLLQEKSVRCVIGYEQGSHDRTRPAFIYRADDVDRLIWNSDCTHNLTVYLNDTTGQNNHAATEQTLPVAVVCKSCDSRALNVLLAENRLQRNGVHVIGVPCGGIRQQKFPETNPGSEKLQLRCERCTEPLPLNADLLIGSDLPINEISPAAQYTPEPDPRLSAINSLSPANRMEYWLSEFDRCLRCYACRQACPLCACPTCLYERDDSLWTGMGIRLDEKRAFHLGRAFHLAGRCIGCDECERVCPENIPISLLNLHLAHELENRFGFSPGQNQVPSPLLTLLDQQERAV